VVDDTRTWFHLTAHTYGAWLHGDPRGFRTRHHRVHVEGDYKNPPPAGMYIDLEARSRRLMKQEAVVLTAEWRRVAGEAMRERLLELGALVLCISVSGQHVHYLAKMSPLVPRRWTGLAKKHAWHVAIDRGWTGSLWAKRSKATPVKDRAHQLKAFDYILRHAGQGAWVWNFRQSPPPAQSPPVATGGL